MKNLDGYAACRTLRSHAPGKLLLFFRIALPVLLCYIEPGALQFAVQTIVEAVLIISHSCDCRYKRVPGTSMNFGVCVAVTKAATFVHFAPVPFFLMGVIALAPAARVTQQRLVYSAVLSPRGY